MKKLLLSVLIMGLSAGVAQGLQRGGAIGAISVSRSADNLIQGFLTAYNRQDMMYFEKTLSPDVVILDDDGHTMTGKDRLLGLLRRRLSTNPPQKLAATDITGDDMAEAAWGSFAYTFQNGDTMRKGLISIVFKKSANDWQIVHLHFAIDMVPSR